MLLKAPMALIVLAAFGWLARLAAQSEPFLAPFLGTWDLDLTASSITRGAPPRIETIVNIAEPGGFRSMLAVVGEKSTSVEIHHYNFDGAFHKTEGSDPRELSFKRVDPSTIEQDTRRNGTVTVHRHIELSRDGKAMTLTANGTTGGGQKYADGGARYHNRRSNCRMKLPAVLALVSTVLAGTVFAQLRPTGHVQTPEADLAYWVFGIPQTSVPVIAVNGGPGLSHIYMLQNDVWDRLSKGRQVIFYDQRGTGSSTVRKADASQSMTAQVADLDAVREHLRFGAFDLVGDSYGGVIAMAYTAAHPEHVHKLILSDSAAPTWKDIVHLFPQVFPDRLESQSGPANPSAPTEAESQQGLREHFGMLFYSEEKRDAYLAGAKDLGNSPGTGAAVRKATANLDLTAALPKFQCPVLVITGRYDMNVAPLTAWRIYKAIPGAKFSAFEKSGHLPSYEEPEKYVRVVKEFLSGK